MRELAGQREAEQRSDQCAAEASDEAEAEIVAHDRRARQAGGAQRADDRALRGDDAGEDDRAGEPTGEQEQQREHDRQRAEALDVLLQRAVGWLLGARHRRGGAGRVGGGGQAAGERRGGRAAIEVDRQLVWAGAGEPLGERLGDEQHGEVVGCDEHLLPALGRPEVLGRRRHANDQKRRAADCQAVCGREPEMRCRVVLDEHPVAGRVATLEQVDAVDGRLRAGGDPDDPAEQPVGAELHRHVGLDAGLHGGYARGRPRALRELGDRAAGDRQVREAVAHERRVIGGLQAAIRLIGGAEQRDAQHDGHADGGELRALAAQVAAQLAAQHPHQPSSRASTGDSLRTSSTIRPSRTRSTRSPIPATAALCVTITTVRPDCRPAS